MYIGILILELVLVILELALLVRQCGIFVFLFLMPLVSQIGKCVSIVYLDSGTYNTELSNYTWNVFAGPSYLFYFIVFLSFLNIFINSVNRKVLQGNKCIIENSRDIRVFILNLIGVMFVSYIGLDLIISGIPILSMGSITRFNYWSDFSKLPAASLVSNMITVICAGIGMIYASRGSDARGRKIGAFIIIVALLERFLLGYRSSGIIDILLAFTIGYFYRRFSIEKQSGKYLKKVCLYSVACILVVAASYVLSQLVSGITIGEALRGLLERQLSLSGHMEWAVLGYGNSRSLGINDAAELLSVIQGKNDTDAGIGVYGLMDRFASTDTYNHYYEDGVRFGASFIATSLFYNGIQITIILIIVNALLLAIFYFAFRRLAASYKIFTFSLLFRVYLVFTSYLNSTGTLVSFYRVNVLLLLGGCVLTYYFEDMLQNMFRSACRRTTLARV